MDLQREIERQRIRDTKNCLAFVTVFIVLPLLAIALLIVNL